MYIKKKKTNHWKGANNFFFFHKRPIKIGWGCTWAEPAECGCNMWNQTLLAVREINKGAFSSSAWLNIILDVIYFGTFCGVLSFSFIKHDANELAHRITKTRSLHDNLQLWHLKVSNALCTQFSKKIKNWQTK